MDSLITLPGLNRGAMSAAAIQLCELAVKDKWLTLAKEWDGRRVGLYCVCFDNYAFAERVYGDWRPGGPLRDHLRSRLSPTVGLKRAAAMTSGALSILLGIMGPVYTIVDAEDGPAKCQQLARMDLEDGRIDLAILAGTFTAENSADADGELNPRCFIQSLDRKSFA